MHLNKVLKGFLPFLCIIGLFKITGIAAAAKGSSGDSKQQQSEYDYSDEAEVPVAEISDTKSSPSKAFFEKNPLTVYFTKEVENLTLECLPKNFNDSSDTILWYNGEHAITTGTTSLSEDKYAIDTKYRLTIYNYSKDNKGNFSCAVVPGEIRQYMIIEFGAPPENITDQNGASNCLMSEIFVIVSALVLSLSYWGKF